MNFRSRREVEPEINVTSPTGAQQLHRFGGANAAAALWDRIEALRAGA